MTYMDDYNIFIFFYRFYCTSFRFHYYCELLPCPFMYHLYCIRSIRLFITEKSQRFHACTLLLLFIVAKCVTLEFVLKVNSENEI